jgi:molybdopterin-containing oxidoreductase family membrane subunit
MEIFMAWYGGNPFEEFMVRNRVLGPYMFQYWSLIACNILLPQLLWLKRVRSSAAILFAIAIIVNIGMWLERYVIIVTSLHRDFLPSSWGMYAGRSGTRRPSSARSDCSSRSCSCSSGSCR